MQELAKASMVNLVILQLKRTHPELIPPNAVDVDPIRHSTIAAGVKRDLLDLIWREAGPETLLTIGKGIRNVTYDPIWRAALRSASPAVLFDKWQRFAVFAHSRNRSRIHQISAKRASVHRYTTDGKTPTTPENLLICGVLLALLENIGCLGLQCEMRLENGAAHCLYEDGQFSIPDNPDALNTSAWIIAWKAFSSLANHTTWNPEPPDVALPQTCNTMTRTLIETVIRILAFDVARQWKVGELAHETGVSSRSLQRKLGDAGLSFSHLVRLVRIHEACDLLKHGDAALTTIGFCSGYSDSAHFSRDFRASMNMTPSEYRAVW